MNRNLNPKLMKHLYLAFIIIALSSCSAIQKKSEEIEKTDVLCVNGIQYIPYTSGKVVAYTSEGKVITCTGG